MAKQSQAVAEPWKKRSGFQISSQEILRVEALRISAADCGWHRIAVYDQF
jgi:hypothetical protein